MAGTAARDPATAVSTRRAHDGSSAGPVDVVRGQLGKRFADRIRRAGAAPHRRPCRLATRLPSDSTTTSSLSSTSSIRCVAQNTLMPSVSHQLADAGEDAGARLDVQPDGRLVEQEQRRPMQQRAGDLDAPHLAAGEAARLVVRGARSCRRCRAASRCAAAPPPSPCRAGRRGRTGSDGR